MRLIDSNFRCAPEGWEQNDLPSAFNWRQVQLAIMNGCSGTNTGITIVQ